MTQKVSVNPLLLVVIVVAVGLASAGTAFLFKQDNSKFAADVSGPFSQEQIVSTTTEKMIEVEQSVTEIVAEIAAAATDTTSKMSAIQQAIDRLNEEWNELTTEQTRQTKCLEAKNLRKQIQTLCYDYTSVNVDRCIELRQKDVDALLGYVAAGESVDSYAVRISEEISKLDQLIILKPQYESAQTDCDQ